MFWGLRYQTWGMNHGLAKRGDKLLKIIRKRRPKHFLEIGVFTGVTAKNVCMLLKKLHGDNYTYTGIDLFEDIESKQISYECAPKALGKSLCSIEAVRELLRGYNASLYKGNSKDVLKTILNIDNIDFVFLDGGHAYDTVYNDLTAVTSMLKKDATILCDDYMGIETVTKAIDDFARDYNFKIKVHNNPSIWKFAEIIR